VEEAARDLAMIGLDRVAGYFGAAAVKAWGAQHPLETMPRMSVDELAERVRDGSVAVLDVRGRAEWDAGHLAGAENIPIGYLADRLAEIRRDRPVAVHCQAGTRSAIATSVPRAHGLDNVLDVRGGFGEWAAAGHPVQR